MAMKAGAKRGRPKKPISLEERLWSRIDQRGPDECWPWKGATNPDGHGILRDGDKLVRAHRKVYELEKGPIPKGKLVLRSCGSRDCCCNPDHLELGTHRDSKLPMLITGRNAKARRLSDEQVLEIVRIRTERQLPYKELGAMFGVSARNASLICNGRIYSWLTGIERSKKTKIEEAT